MKHCGNIKLPIEGLQLNHVGQPVFASDDNTFTLKAEHNSRIGVVYRYESESIGMVAFNSCISN